MMDQVPGQEMRVAPQFAPVKPLKLAADAIDDLVSLICDGYSAGVQARNEWNADHLMYDQMFRGNIAEFNPREGPWEGAANLHVQAPYWVVDALNVRLISTVWNQTPQVVGKWTEPRDKEVASKAAARVEWLLELMKARSNAERISKIRLIHGNGVGLVTYAKDEYLVRKPGTELRVIFNDDGTPAIDAEGAELFEDVAKEEFEVRTKYHGPSLYPLEWDDVVVPMGGFTNLQPQTAGNPGGCYEVHIRKWEYLSQLEANEELYPWLMKKEQRDRQWWIDKAPPQDLSGRDNEDRERRQDESEGRQQSPTSTYMGSKAKNPKFEILMTFRPWEVQGRQEECMFLVCRQPQVLLGAWLLSDIVWTGKRPLYENGYQTVSNRWYRMGVCEIMRYLSEELDTMHNMRIDVGFATNMPWFFYRASSSFNPDDIQIKPLKGVPVDDPNAVKIPQFSNVTSFYHAEETLLLSYIERCLGITDLFLGVSPTRGAAARTATGFAGTQQESLIRISNIIQDDAEAFAFLCGLLYDLDIQYGPEERTFRLGDTDFTKLSRDDLWFQGTYDFRLGANYGTWSQNIQMQQAQQALQVAGMSPLTNQDPGRRWEAEARFYRALRWTETEIEAVIGPKNAVSQGTPRPQREENMDMAQFLPGPNIPARTHPADDDQGHAQEIYTFLASDEYNALGRPNEQAFLAHAQLHQKQMQMKMAQMQHQSGANPPGRVSSAQSMMNTPMRRAQSQIDNVGPPQGGPREAYQAQTQAVPEFLQGKIG